MTFIESTSCENDGLVDAGGILKICSLVDKIKKQFVLFSFLSSYEAFATVACLLHFMSVFLDYHYSSYSRRGEMLTNVIYCWSLPLLTECTLVDSTFYFMEILKITSILSNSTYKFVSSDRICWGKLSSNCLKTHSSIAKGKSIAINIVINLRLAFRRNNFQQFTPLLHHSFLWASKSSHKDINNDKKSWSSTWMY